MVQENSQNYGLQNRKMQNKKDADKDTDKDTEEPYPENHYYVNIKRQRSRYYAIFIE